MSLDNSYNIVLDKIPCLYTIEYDNKNKTTKIVDSKPKVDVENIDHASIKLDGECCYLPVDSVPMRRRDIKPGSKIPDNWIETSKEADQNTKHRIGFIPIETD